MVVEKKSKCHHLLSVWTESDVTHMRTQSYSLDLQVKQAIPLCAEHTRMCMHVYICINLCAFVHICVCVCVCVRERSWQDIEWGAGKGPCSIVMGLGDFGFHCETENHGLRERGDQLSSAAYPRQQISLHQLFRFIFFSAQDNMDIRYGMEGRWRHRQETLS